VKAVARQSKVEESKEVPHPVKRTKRAKAKGKASAATGGKREGGADLR
jgi:hypothetical protein